MDPVTILKDAYADRDYERLTGLLADVDGARFRFFLHQPLSGGQADWGVTEELSIHHRMFEPEQIAPPEPPLPGELKLVDIDIALTPQGEWVEAPEFYLPGNPEGLDTNRWRAAKSVFSTYVFFQTRGPTHYQVNGRASFVIIEDKTKPLGAEGKFLLWRWFDLGAPDVPAASIAGVEPVTWTGAKGIYRRASPGVEAAVAAGSASRTRAEETLR